MLFKYVICFCLIIVTLYLIIEIFKINQEEIDKKDNSRIRFRSSIKNHEKEEFKAASGCQVSHNAPAPVSGIHQVQLHHEPIKQSIHISQPEYI